MPRPHKPYYGGKLRITLSEDEARHHVELRRRHPNATDSDLYRLLRKSARDPAVVSLDAIERFIWQDSERLGDEVAHGLARAVALARGSLDPDVRNERLRAGDHPLGPLAPPDPRNVDDVQDAEEEAVHA